MPKKTKVEYATSVEALKHKDKRVNIPTEELRDFVVEEEEAPKTMFYPRDPSLDPQLVWKGKDKQDQHPLEVPVVPVYIQEKNHPQAIIEDIRGQARKEHPEEQLGLFADFNGIEFEQLIDFYQHEQNWANRMILGDSLLVMTSLAEKEGLKGKVQMIYMDPPYGIKFGSNWQVSTRKRDVRDGRAEDATRQPEQIKAFRDTWELGIHSYLSYLRDRLVVARELLTDTGSVFVQIGDENVHLVRSLLDEVFGGENFVSLITFSKTSGQTDKFVASVDDYLLWYAKERSSTKFRHLLFERQANELRRQGYTYVETYDGQRRKLKKGESLTKDVNVYALSGTSSQTRGASEPEPFLFEGQLYTPETTRGWSTTTEGLHRLSRAHRLDAIGTSLRYIRFHKDFPYTPITNHWDDVAFSTRSEDKIYVVQTSVRAITRCLLMTTDPGDLVLDPTCGSGTTAYVAEQWGRRWITVDTSRVALALARTRLMAAKFPYYILSDSPEGIKKEAEVTGNVPPIIEETKTENDIKKGFLYKRVPHITLKSIANNEEIDVIYAKWQEKLEPIRADLDDLLNQSWEEWQVPREPQEHWPEKAKQLHKDWWQLRGKRQKAMDESIARRADTELLYDQPYEDRKRIRVTGRFTVESLSPHRVLSTDDERPASQAVGQKESPISQFETMIIENLKKAGVQNTIKNERLKFDRLESYAGVWIHAEGEYTENGESKRVAICIGPEHGTVGPQLLKEAAKEAVQGIGFDLLIVGGFAFDPHVSEEAKRYGKLTVLTTRMNPDLAMGDELLKKTGAGNLFMVFGEPDVDIKTQSDGTLVVTIKGVDVYDPTTGEIRSSSTDDIACWFIDTDYNGESFFVRHAYFTGVDKPYDKLKRALRAEIDEGAWSALYSTKSRPFDPPDTGKIAVKVINHYGDEVLKVFEV